MYVILGASGKTGGHAADAIVRTGKPVRVVVRNAEKSAAWKARGADGEVADVDVSLSRGPWRKPISSL
jgi:uncharacterized protein YbjT (DUF2867 family)